MLKYSLIVSLACYTGVMFAIGLLSGLVASAISLQDFNWFAPGLAFASVFLAGFVSLLVTCLLGNRDTDPIVSAMSGTFIRTALIAATIVIVVITQPKNVAFYVLCFSIVYYLGMLPVCTWLTIRSSKQQTPG